MYPPRPTLILVYFLSLFCLPAPRSQSPEDTTLRKGAWQRKQHALLALEQPQGSPQRSSELKLLVGLKSQLYTQAWTPEVEVIYCPLGEIPPHPSWKCLCQDKATSDTPLVVYQEEPPFLLYMFYPMLESREGLQISQEDALTACSPSTASTDLCLSENFCFAAQACSNHTDVEKKTQSKHLL